MDITSVIEKLDYKKMIAIPIIIITILGIAVGVNWSMNESPVPLGMEFSGGTYLEITGVENVPSTANIEDSILEEFDGEANVVYSEEDDELNIETILFLNAEDVDNLESFLETEFGITGEYTSPQRMGPELTSLYQQQAQRAAVAAAIAISIIIFVAFRDYTTVGGILSVVGLDLVGVLGGMVIFNIPLTLASMAGIVLIIGYAIDDNVLLYSRVLQRVGEDVKEKTAGAMETGLTMAITSGSALFVLNIFTTIPALQQLSAVIVMGITLDAMNTWLFNAGLIMRHAEKKKGEYRGRI